MHRRLWALCATMLASLAAGESWRDQPPGLAVVIGSATQDAVALAGPAGAVVALFTNDPTCPDAIDALARPAGCHGRIQIHPAPVRGQIPLGDRLVDLLVDPEGALTDEECTRLVRPGGHSVRKGARRPAPADPRLADWTQWRAGPGRTGYVDDHLAGLPQALHWQAGALQDETPQLCAAGVLISLSTASGLEPARITARNPWNGLLRWTAELDMSRVTGKGLRWMRGVEINAASFAVSRDKVLVVGRAGTVAFDAMTGAMTPCGALSASIDNLLVVPDGVLGASDTQLVYADPSGTTVRWTWNGAARDLCVDGDTAFCIDERKKPWSIVAIDLATGAERWRVATDPWWAPHGSSTKPSADDSAYPGVRLAMAVGGRCILRTYSGEVAGSAPNRHPIIALDAATGAAAWTWSPPSMAALKIGRQGYGASGGPISFRQTMVQLGPNLVVTQERWRFQIAIATGENRGATPFAWAVNEHCQVASACPATVSFKDNAWLDVLGKQSGIEPNGKGLGGENAPRLGNSTCGYATIIAQGQAFFGTKHCKCLMGGAHVRSGTPIGNRASAPSPQTAGGRATAADAAPASNAWPMFHADPQRSNGTDATLPGKNLKILWSKPLSPPAAGSFVKDVAAGSRLSAPVIGSGLVVVAEFESGTIHAHALQDGAPRWRYHAGSRVDGPPTLTSGLAVCGFRDGSVRCLALASGREIWRTGLGLGLQQSGARRLLVAHGAVEAAVPAAASVCIVDGRVYATSGRLPADADGTWISALDLATGAVIWQERNQHLPSLPQVDTAGRIHAPSPYGWQYFFGNRINWPIRDGATGAAVAITGDPPAMVVQRHDYHQSVRSSGRQMKGAPLRALVTEVAEGERSWAIVHGADHELIAYTPKQLGKEALRSWREPLEGLARKSIVSATVSVPGLMHATALARGGHMLVAGGSDKNGKGLLATVSTQPAATVLEIQTLPAAPVYQGIAVVTGRIVVALTDGTLLVLGTP